MDEITFEVASVANISLFVAEIIIREHVITSSLAKLTYVVAKIILNVVLSLFQWPKSLL